MLLWVQKSERTSYMQKRLYLESCCIYLSKWQICSIIDDSVVPCDEIKKKTVSTKSTSTKFY